MSDVPEVTCPACHKSFSERQLSTKSFTVESCPYCQQVIRKEEGWSSTNITAMIAGDVAAIDAWLDNHSNARGVKIAKRNTEQKKEYRWSVEANLAWPCEIAYSTSRPGFISVRLLSTDDTQAVVGHPATLHAICGNHGVEPFGERHSDGITGEVAAIWGAAQHFSTDTLCEEQFEPILQRLDAAMKDVQAHLLGRCD